MAIMFTRLGLRNFKAWRGTHAIDLRPLTLVLGVNSAGKTSLLQPLLLLKQTVESPDRLQSLSLGGQPGDILDLGRFSDVVSGRDPSAGLGFRLTFGPVGVGEGAEPRTLESVQYEVDYESTKEGVPYVQRLSYYTEAGVYGAARVEDGKYELTAPDPPSPDQRRTGRTYEPERSVGFSADAVAALGTDGPDAQDIALALTRELQQISYLGPLRSRPERFLVWSGRSPGQLGSSGQATVPALVANLLRGDRDGSNRGRLVRQVSEWTERLGLADKIEIEQIGPVMYQVTVTIQGRKANLLDVGFGVSQVLPVVTLAFFAPEGSMVILEQPELHLHPLAQAALGELLVHVGRERRLQFLVETHSEHLFRRLQTLIAEERLASSECAMLFINRKDGDSSLEPLELNEYGRVANWPDKFFGDIAGEVERQVEMTMERMEKEGQGG